MLSVCLRVCVSVCLFCLCLCVSVCLSVRLDDIWCLVRPQGKIGAQFAKILSHHYPERLGRLLLINPPRLFDVLLAACRPFVSKRTMDKMCSVHGSIDEVLAHMDAVHGFDENTRRWFGQVRRMSCVRARAYVLTESNATCMRCRFFEWSLDQGTSRLFTPRGETFS